MLTSSIVRKSGPGTSKVRVEWLDSLFPQTGHSNFFYLSPDPKSLAIYKSSFINT